MFDIFTKQYQLSKTLRFELKPIAKTKDYIEQKGLLREDEERAEDYKRVKKIIDDYHKDFIHKSLSGVKLEALDEFEKLYFLPSKDDKTQKEFEKLQESLRKQIASAFRVHPTFKNLFAKELIKDELTSFVTDESDRALIEKFKNFTTYFTGFHENRANMYTHEPKHSAVVYRIVHENLPIFLSNKKAFEGVRRDYPQLLEQTQSSLLEHLEGGIVEDMFSLEYFSFTLSQKYIDLYNTMLGGKTLEDGTKIQGFNEKINLHRQANGIDKRKLPNFKALNKQILSDRESLSWLPEAFKTKEERTEAVRVFYAEHIAKFQCCDGIVDLLERIPELFTAKNMYEPSKIFVKNDLSLTAISQSLFSDYRTIREALWQKHLSQSPKAQKSRDLAGDEERFFNRKNSFFSVAEIEAALSEYASEKSMFDYFYKGAEQAASEIKAAYASWVNNPNDTKTTKELLDAILSMQRHLKPLYVKTDTDKDIAFYAMFDTYFESLNGISKLYDKVRNFETKKPYSLEKFKLNFENSTLLDGWDVNKEPDNTAILFFKDGLYYLGIMDKKHNRILKNIQPTTKEGGYKKVEYKLLPGANKMLPKVFFSNSRIGEFAPSAQLLENYKNDTHKKGDKFSLADCHALIDFFKASIQKHEDWKHFGFNFSPTSSYEDLSGFYREVEQQGYKIAYKNIEAEYIDTLVDEGKLYLFQIYNKDFSPYSKGTPNMHTLYWRALFDEQNLADVVYKLNGQAEIFYRKKSLDYSEEKLKVGHHPELKTFAYPIIKDRRFAFDKFQFHVPITLNFKATGGDNINAHVNGFVAKNSESIKIIGIDRGERHLLYVSLIDAKGRMVEQYSLNQIINSYNGKEHIIDYHDKLTKREDERAKARVEWGNVENIKELKEGYMSHVIHRIATLMVEHNAIVVLEDLNFGFKRGRFKVEKQVYQKFEKMLIDKLNYLVDKQKSPDEIGGVLNALQLTNKFESFEKMGKQSGFLYYVPAWNTSKIDPVTGFVNLFDARYTSVEKAKEFFGKFKSIRYSETKGYFEFEFDYKDFTDKGADTRTAWTLCTHGERIKTFRNPDTNNQWDSKTVHLTTEFKNLFGSYGGDLKSYISAQTEKRFFEELLYLFRLTLQMRNSVTGTDVDYLVSPVADANGEFYDSRRADATLPKDADANGAYNIARKGLMLVQKIKNADDMKKIDFKITNKEWLRFAQGLEG